MKFENRYGLRVKSTPRYCALPIGFDTIKVFKFLYKHNYYPEEPNGSGQTGIMIDYWGTVYLTYGIPSYVDLVKHNTLFSFLRAAIKDKN